jgi:3-isopropylmalate/(R)-2-methylmalate dehydratase small subunit
MAYDTPGLSSEPKVPQRTIEGPILKLSHRIDTDLIYPGKYLSVRSPDEMTKHVFEHLDSEIRAKIRPSTIIVAGRNFGCGSSRSQAVTALKYAGVAAIVAISFARLYFRNCINQGLPVIICPEAFELFQEGKMAQIDLVGGAINSDGLSLRFTPLPDFLLKILSMGGLVPYTRNLNEREG